MADQSRRPWAWDRLPDDVLYEIVRRIPCEVDRLHTGRVCHSWRVGLVKLKPPAPPPPLPWLVLPRAHGSPTFSCVLSGCCTHPLFVPHGVRSARYFGSYDGVWLFLAVDGQRNQAQDHVLVNLSNFQFIDLPNLAHVDMMFPVVVNRDCEMAIVAATLSCKPTEQGCIVAGFIEYSPFPGLVTRHAAFWRMGDQVVLPPIWVRVAATSWMEEPQEDLIYHKGAFHFLTRTEHILACEEPPVFHEDVVELIPANMYFQPRGGSDDDDETVLARYLVESRTRLLMVVRLTSRRQHLPTSAFRVFQKKEFNKGEEDEPLNNGAFQFQYYWSELPALEGRMLFVGRGCSRSYETANGYPGMEGVYFLDDRTFYEPSMPYRCSDNGKWSEAPTGPQVDRCFPARGPSKYSPPVWILP
ncbi:hypothetical protein E2562_010006 [Oryza meyeriana var. granulata]|uniref:KIB1-4 beta-propeller domain-containing protein n=1 Tax=Oryza meyeriana var. granulata TaxID=110450 RepID=A0A6G1EI88_9ORYZ|nr:hypothetical protein E2562_010006 [Oryza meyeriana var. granulata]